MLGVSWSWNDDTSSATQSGASVAQRQLGQRRADVARRDARRAEPSKQMRVSAVVVVLPFVPVIAM